MKKILIILILILTLILVIKIKNNKKNEIFYKEEKNLKLVL